MGAAGLVDSPEDLTVPGFHSFQLLPGLIGILQKRDHGQSAGQLPRFVDRIQVDKINILDLLPRRMQNRCPHLQHFGEPGSRAQVPQLVALNWSDVASGLPVEKLAVRPIGEHDHAVPVNDVDSLAHGI